MQIQITTRHLDRTPGLIDLAQRRAHYALDRFGALVRVLEIRLADVNGPKGGQGISCLAQLRLVDGGSVVVESAACTPEDGISRTLARLTNRLRRMVSRRHDHHH